MLHSAHDFRIRNTPFPGWFDYAPNDPGWLYILRQGDLFKIGKTANPKRRLREARTWLPSGELVGMKPFWDVHTLERTLLCGIANHWLEGEWHQFPDDTYSDFLGLWRIRQS